MIKFRCSNCNKKFGVPDDYAGRRIRCNTCDKHTIVPKPCGTACGLAAAPGCAAAAEQNESDSDLILSLSKEDRPMKFVSIPEEADIQLQSFHNYPQPEPNTDEPASADAIAQVGTPDVKQGGKSIWKRRWFGTDPELTLNILSFISCIGPALFLSIFFYMMLAMAVGDSQWAMTAHPAPPVDPNMVSASDPVTTLSVMIIVMYTSYAFGFVISPIALIWSMVLVFRYKFDMPKMLYVAIVIYGFMFFTFFRG